MLTLLLLLLVVIGCSGEHIPPPNSNFVCINNGHAVGRWVPRSPEKKAYYVCGWDAHDYRNNPDVCGTRYVQNETLIQGFKNYNMQTGGRGTMCDIRDRTRNAVSAREKYAWEPMLCHLIPWDAALFCKLLGKRKLFLMGDSRVQQIAASLMSQVVSDLKGTSHNSCADQLYFGHYNTFEPNVELAKLHINTTQPDIIITNIGAHFHRIEAYEADLKFFQRVKSDVVTHKNTQWVWLTNSPGHVHCSQTSGGAINNHYIHRPDGGDKFHWRLFPHMDAIGKAEATRLGMKVIDMSPLYYRQDAHSDCLHFCMPGPLDLFNVLIMNMLYNKEL